MRTIVAVVIAFVVAVALVFLTAWIGDRFDLRFFTGWAVMHATGILLFPIYFVAALFVFRRAFRSRTTSGNHGRAA